MAEEQIVTNIVARSDFSNLIGDLNKVSSALTKLQEKLIASNKTLAAQVAVANRSFEATLRSTGQFATHFVSLTSDVDKFGNQLDKGQIKLRQFFNVYQNHIKTNNGLIRDLAKQQVQLQNAILQPLGKNAQGLMQYNVHIPQGLDVIANKTKIAKQELAIMNRLVQEGAGQLINWGKNTQWAGRQLTVGLTVPIVAFGKAASDAFLKADQELVRLTKVYGGLAATSSTELMKVRKDVSSTAKELSKTLGSSYNETLGLAADIAATGKTGNELLGSVRETTRLAVLGEVDRQDAMKATLAIQSAFKQNTAELADSINFLNAVENQTSTTLNDLVEAIPKAGPVVKGLGGDIQDLALYLTAMREGGINATEGANALKSALASLINPTKVATQMFADFGIDLKGIVTSNAGNLTETILSLQAALDRLNPLQKQQALEQLFGKFQFARMNALFENLGRQGSQTLAVLDLMKATSTDLANIAGRELTQVTESASGKYKRAVEGLRADLSDIGDQFLNINTKLINFVDGVVNFMDKLPGPVKQALSLLGGLTAIAGPLIMLTGVLGNFFGYIIKGIYHFKSFFKNAEGWKLLTPEILAAQKAGNLVEQTFYSDAKAAAILRQAIDQLAMSYDHLNAAQSGASVSVNPTFSTPSGGVVVGGYDRQVNPKNKYVGEIGTRAAAHNIPVSLMTPEQKAAQTIFSVTPGPIPVNQKIGAVPQIFTHSDMPNVPGLTTNKGVSTGVVATEAAKWHSMMGMLSMLSKKEVATLKTEIQNTGTMSAEFMQTFSTLFPQVSGVIDTTVQQSAKVVEMARANQITVEQARARIIALNAQMEASLAQVTSEVATSMGRTADLTAIPLLNQPVVNASGKSNMKELFRKKRPESRIIDRIARLLGVKTYGAGYSTETTIPRRLNAGGRVYDPSRDGNVVPGDTSINYDNTPAVLQEGGYILNQEASRNNPDLVSLAKNQHAEGGKIVPAMLTPGETYFPPSVTEQMLPTLEAANSGSRIKFSAVGGRVTSGKTNYGIPAWEAFKRLAVINSRYLKSMPKEGDPSRLGWFQEFRARSIMHDSAILSERGMPRHEALRRATADFEDAYSYSIHKTGKDKGSINNELWTERRKEQFLKLDSDLKKMGHKPLRSSSRAAVVPNKKTIDFLRSNADSFGGIEHVDRILRQLHMIDEKGKVIANKAGLVQGNMVTEHTRPYSMWGYTATGNYGQAMWGEAYINSASNYLRSQTTIRRSTNPSLQGFTFFPDQLIKTDKGLMSYENAFRQTFGMNLQDLVEFEKRGVSALPPKLRKMVSPTESSVRDLLMGKRLNALKPVFGYAAANSGGLIGGRVVLGKHNYGKYRPRTTPKPPMLGPELPPDPRLAHGVHQIGTLANELYVRNHFVPRRIHYYLPALYGTPGNYYRVKGLGTAADGAPRYSARGGFRQPWDIGSEEYRAKQALYRYMKGDYSVLKEPGVQGLLSSIREKATGTFYRGLQLGRGSLPAHIEDALLFASKTGDYTPLIGQTFIMRRSSWSANPETAKGFGDVLVQSFIKNRNVVPASKIFPELELPTGKGGMQKFNESESYFGGKFKILSADATGIKIEGVREKGGDVKSGKAYVVGEKGPEIFIPNVGGGIVPNYALGGKVKGGKFNYGEEADIVPKQPKGLGLATNVLGMAGGFAGSAVGAKFGTVGNIAGWMLGQLAAEKLVTKALTRGLGEAATKTGLLTNLFQKALALPGWLKLTAVVVGVGMAIKKVHDEINKHRAIVNQAFAPTKDTIEKLNLKYVNLSDRIKQAREQIQLMQKAGLNVGTQNVALLPGISTTVKELEQLKAKVKKDLPDLVAVFDKAKPSEVVDKAAQMKAQFIAGGMSAEEATKLIHGLISASNDANMALQALASDKFRNLKNETDAANISIKTFNELLANGNRDQLGPSFDQLINSFMSLENSYLKLKDSQGNLTTQSQAFEKVIDYISKQYGKNVVLKNNELAALKQQVPLLELILGKTESMESAYAKIKLYTAGINFDLSSVDPSKAAAVVDTILKVQTALGSTTGPYKDLASAVSNAEKASKAMSSSAVKAAARTRESLQDEIELRNKNIDAIKKEYDAKRKSLQEQQQDEDTLTEIKKKQLEYQSALARGDVSTAAQTQLDIQSLVSKQQKTLAERALNKAEETAIGKEQTKIDALTAQLKQAEKTINAAGETAQNASDRLAKLAPLLAQVIKATIEFPADQVIDDAEKATIKDLISKLKPYGMKDTIAQLQQTLNSPPPGIKSPDYKSPLETTFDTYFTKYADETNKALRVNVVNLSDFKLGGAKTEPTKEGIVPYYPKAGEKGYNPLGIPQYKDAATGKTVTYEQAAATPNLPPAGTEAMKHPTLSGKSFSAINGSPSGVKMYTSKDGTVYDTYGNVYSKAGKFIGRWYGYSVADSSKIIAYEDGGKVTGPGTGTSDSIHAMLSNGEYVVNAKSVAALGVPFMDNINKMANGGLARYDIPSSSVRTDAFGQYRNAGNVVYALNQTVNPAPGMNEERLADLASRRTLEMINQLNNTRASKIGPGRIV